MPYFKRYQLVGGRKKCNNSYLTDRTLSLHKSGTWQK